MPLSIMHRQYIPSARMVIFFLLLLLATGVARAATYGVTTPGQQTLTNRFLPYAGSGTQLIGNSPAWRDSAGVLGINNYLEGLETLTPGAAVNLNFSTWRTKRITLNQNTIFTAINIPSASTNVQTMLLEVIGDGAFTVSFANVTWQTPEITTPEAGVVTLYALRGDSGAVKGYTQAVAASGVTTINPGNGYIPYRSNATTFADSPLYWNSATASSVSMLITNANSPNFIIAGQNTNASTSFITLNVSDSDGQQDAVYLNGGKLAGWDAGTPGTRDGYYSLNVLTDNSMKLRMEVDGDSTGAWWFFSTDGSTTAAKILSNSGYTGAGTLFLSDDGTYKAAGGGTTGTIVNTGTPVVGNVPYYSDTTGTNVAPSGALILGASTNASTIGIQSSHANVATNGVTFSETDTAFSLSSDPVRVPTVPVAVFEPTTGQSAMILDLMPTGKEGEQTNTLGTGAAWIDLLNKNLRTSASPADWSVARLAIATNGNVTMGAYAFGTNTVGALNIVAGPSFGLYRTTAGGTVASTWASGNSTAWFQSSHMYFNADDTYDIGAAGATRPRYIRTSRTYFGGVTSPAQITADQNNYNPGGQGKYLRLSTDASRSLTGLTFTTAQASGEEHLIVNVGAQDIVLVHESASSTDVNRFLSTTAANITLTANQQASVWYDSTTQRWRTNKQN